MVNAFFAALNLVVARVPNNIWMISATQSLIFRILVLINFSTCGKSMNLQKKMKLKLLKSYSSKEKTVNSVCFNNKL